MQKRAIAVHDISCVGRCSLTVALPVLSAAGLNTAGPAEKHRQADEGDNAYKQQGQPEEIVAVGEEQMLYPEQEQAEKSADNRADKTVAAAQDRVIGVAAQAENGADAGECGITGRKGIKQRCEGGCDSRLDASEAKSAKGGVNGLFSVIHYVVASLSPFRNRKVFSNIT